MYKSDTLWFNALVIVSSIGTGLLADETFRVMVGDNIGWIGTVLGIIGVILRLTTTKPIEITKDNPQGLNPVDNALRKEAEDHDLV